MIGQLLRQRRYAVDQLANFVQGGVLHDAFKILLQHRVSIQQHGLAGFIFDQVGENGYALGFRSQVAGQERAVQLIKEHGRGLAGVDHDFAAQAPRQGVAVGQLPEQIRQAGQNAEIVFGVAVFANAAFSFWICTWTAHR